jgi:hypothetical protein
MKKKYFGAYLIEKGLISESELVGVLIQQLKTIPSACEVVHKNNLLSASEIYKIFNCQSSTGQDFISAASSLSLWTTDLEKRVQEMMNSQKALLGELLISKGLIRTEVLVDALDEYINEPAAEEVQLPKVKVAEEKVSEEKVAAVVFQKQPDTADTVKVEIVEYFSPDYYKKIMSDAQTLELEKLVGLVREVRGRVYLAELRRLNSILGGLEGLLRINMTSKKVPEVQEYRSLVQDSFSLSWDIVKAWQNGISEEAFIKSPEHATAVAFLVKQISDHKQRELA